MSRIAIIGSGISGLGCAWFLDRKHELTIFEADTHIGGHSNTVTVKEGAQSIPIDTGFMVYNDATYPNLIRLFKHLGVPTKPTSMSFSVHHGPSGVEWNGDGLYALFAQRKNLFNLRHWRFLLQLHRFNKEAVTALNEPKWHSMSLGEYVDTRGYGKHFLERYLIPMSSAVWSTPPDKMLHFPAITLLRFWYNHGFLGLSGQHPWRTVEGGSREYVKRLTGAIQARIHTQTPVKRVQRSNGKVLIETEPYGIQSFDRVILATHAPQALQLLEAPTSLERAVLAPFCYQPNRVKLHTNTRVMPKTRRCWASWNYRTEGNANNARSSIHYWMNNLQGVSQNQHYFVSLNCDASIPEDDCLKKLDYEHPLFNLEAIKAQERIEELNDPGHATGTFFCGAWTRYGFHEDGLLSAVNLCRTILQGDPWELR